MKVKILTCLVCGKGIYDVNIDDNRSEYCEERHDTLRLRCNHCNHRELGRRVHGGFTLPNDARYDYVHIGIGFQLNNLGTAISTIEVEVNPPRKYIKPETLIYGYVGSKPMINVEKSKLNIYRFFSYDTAGKVSAVPIDKKFKEKNVITLDQFDFIDVSEVMAQGD